MEATGLEKSHLNVKVIGDQGAWQCHDDRDLKEAGWGRQPQGNIQRQMCVSLLRWQLRAIHILYVRKVSLYHS